MYVPVSFRALVVTDVDSIGFEAVTVERSLEVEIDEPVAELLKAVGGIVSTVVVSGSE